VSEGGVTESDSFLTIQVLAAKDSTNGTKRQSKVTKVDDGF
jgi:hypothetical protein